MYGSCKNPWTAANSNRDFRCTGLSYLSRQPAKYTYTYLGFWGFTLLHTNTWAFGGLHYFIQILGLLGVSTTSYKYLGFWGFTLLHTNTWAFGGFHYFIQTHGNKHKVNKHSRGHSFIEYLQLCIDTVVYALQSRAVNFLHLSKFNALFQNRNKLAALRNDNCTCEYAKGVSSILADFKS
jgi:hypothetical protein